MKLLFKKTYMKNQKLLKKIEDQAKTFKSREVIGHGDVKRHDLIKPDEQKCVWIVNKQLGWSFAKIGSVFNRDRRTIKKAVEGYNVIEKTTPQKPYEESLQKKAEEISNEDDPLKRHFAELSESALTLAGNLEKFLYYQGTNFKSEIGDIVYGGLMEVDVEYTGLTRHVKMAIFPQFLAFDLLSHIRDEYPDLTKINKWAELTSNELTYDLIARLVRTAKKGEYNGKCKDCPS